jgi:NAD(P)-dependent dehydrogenase (short-subunit alcohol dehydrogenase family)
LNGNVVVLGASGGIGRAIVSELIAAGHQVIAVARNREGLDALAERVAAPRQLTLLQGSVATDADAMRLAEQLRELRGRVATVIASVGGPIEGGRLIDRPASFLSRTFDDNVVPHFIAAKHLLPLLAESGRDGLYLLLGSPAAECTWAGYGHLSVSAVAVRMLIQVLREEIKELPVSMRQLQLGTPVRTEKNTKCACPDWIGADEVARRVVELIGNRKAAEPVVRIGSYTRSTRMPP